MSDLASSNGRTPNFDFGNSGSTPLARAIPTAHAKKLRALVPACDDPADYTSDDRVMLEAADAIEAAEARALAAEARAERAEADVEVWRAKSTWQARENSENRFRAERAEAALRDLVFCIADDPDQTNLGDYLDRARAALTPTGE